ncbi:MAG: pilus assembly protein N-terminal domain-containing protein [Candidatus Firestonebacteria bacterium]
MKKYLLAVLFCFLFFNQTFSEEKIQITVGESKIIQIDSPKKIAVGDPKVADLKVISEKEILLIGKSAGSTSLIIWDKDNNQITKQVVVLTSELEKTMVEVNVQVLEMNKSAVNDFGINWSDTLNALNIGEKTIPPIFQIGDFERLESIKMKLNTLVKNGQAKMLAKPRLLTISGSKALFLSGGELPILYQDSQKMNVEWKEYGVKLDIQPTADVLQNINVEIRVEVSNLDASTGVNYNGNIIPALKTRWAKTSIYVKKGGTIVIAGLIQTEEVKREEGIPILSDLPLLGILFKSFHTETSESELVIFVTPSVVGK